MIMKFAALVLVAFAQTSWADDTASDDFYDANENYGYGTTYTSIYTPTYHSYPSSASNNVESVGSLDSHPVGDLDVPVVELEVPASEIEMATNELTLRMVAQDGRENLVPVKPEERPLKLSLRKSRK